MAQTMAFFNGPASEVQRAMNLMKKREREQEEMERKKKKIENELEVSLARRLLF